jgi:hypothetical protein
MYPEADLVITTASILRAGNRALASDVGRILIGNTSKSPLRPAHLLFRGVYKNPSARLKGETSGTCLNPPNPPPRSDPGGMYPEAVMVITTATTASIFRSGNRAFGPDSAEL